MFKKIISWETISVCFGIYASLDICRGKSINSIRYEHFASGILSTAENKIQFRRHATEAIPQRRETSARGTFSSNNARLEGI